eukprot:8292098-Pyramimonas_sp.AAC.1
MAQGASPTALKQLRSKMAAPTGKQRAGGCATVAIRLGPGKKGDPLFFARHDMVKQWLHILPALMRERIAVQAAWTKCVGAMRAAVHPWGKVRGPIAALVTTLLQSGWDPQPPR